MLRNQLVGAAGLAAALTLAACGGVAPGGDAGGDSRSSAAEMLASCRCWSADALVKYAEVDPTISCSGSGIDVTCAGAKGTTVLDLVPYDAGAVCYDYFAGLKLMVGTAEAEACASLLELLSRPACPCWTADTLASYAAIDPKMTCTDGATGTSCEDSAGQSLFRLVPYDAGAVCYAVNPGLKLMLDATQAAACKALLAPYLPAPTADGDANGVPDTIDAACAGASPADFTRCVTGIVDAYVAQGLLTPAQRGATIAAAHRANAPGTPPARCPERGTHMACKTCHLKI